MKTEPIDEKVAEILHEAQPPLSANWDERALQAMASARLRRTRSRRRLLAVALGAMAMLTAIGFVPFPAGRARGAWDRALAAANQSPGVHLAGHLWTPVGEFDFEQWYTNDGFSRYDLYEEGNLVGRWLFDQERRSIRPRWHGSEIWAERYRAPSTSTLPRQGVFGSLFGPVASQLGDVGECDVYPRLGKDVLGGATGSLVTSRAVQWEYMFDLRVDEWLQRTLWQGARAVVEVRGRRKESGGWEDCGAVLGSLMYPLNEEYLTGDQIRIHAEIDPDTRALLAFEQYKWVDGRWAPNCRLDTIEWPVEIGDDIRDVEAPEGHIEFRDNWWQGRLRKAMAVGNSDDWLVTLHAVDLNRNGDLYVTVSRQPKSGAIVALPSESGRLRALSVSAVDDVGVHYSVAVPTEMKVDMPRLIEGYPDPVVFGIPECHARIRLAPDRPAVSSGVARTLTVAVTNSSPEGSHASWQSVTFRDLPLPARQVGEDLVGESVEKIEY